MCRAVIVAAAPLLSVLIARLAPPGPPLAITFTSSTAVLADAPLAEASIATPLLPVATAVTLRK